MPIIHATRWLGSALHSIIPISVTGAMQNQCPRPTLPYIGPHPTPSQVRTVMSRSRSSSLRIGCARYIQSMSSRTRLRRGVMLGLNRRGPFDGGMTRGYETIYGAGGFSGSLIPLFVESCLSGVANIEKKLVRNQDGKPRSHDVWQIFCCLLAHSSIFSNSR